MTWISSRFPGRRSDRRPEGNNFPASREDSASPTPSDLTSSSLFLALASDTTESHKKQNRLPARIRVRYKSRRGVCLSHKKAVLSPRRTCPSSVTWGGVQ